MAACRVASKTIIAAAALVSCVSNHEEIIARSPQRAVVYVEPEEMRLSPSERGFNLPVISLAMGLSVESARKTLGEFVEALCAGDVTAIDGLVARDAVGYQRADWKRVDIVRYFSEAIARREFASRPCSEHIDANAATTEPVVQESGREIVLFRLSVGTGTQLATAYRYFPRRSWLVGIGRAENGSVRIVRFNDASPGYNFIP